MKSILLISVVLAMFSGCSVAQKTMEFGRGMSNNPILLPIAIPISKIGEYYYNKEIDEKKEEAILKRKRH